MITTSVINSLYINPSAPTTYWVRRYDPAPCNHYTDGITFNVFASTVSTSPTAISGVTTICKGTSTVLTATGGTAGSACYYEWGTGYSVGDNTISEANGASITVSPSASTIYWVRRMDPAPCNRQTYGPTVTVTVPLPVTYSGSGWSGTPNATTPIIVSSDLNLSVNLKVCSCDVVNSATLNIKPSATLTVRRSVTVAPTASLICENTGSLVQIDDDAFFAGAMTVKRNTAPMKTYDYSYWSAPVTGWPLNQLSPLTLSDKYYSFNPAINNWVSIAGGNAPMQAGKGYIIRAPQGWSLTNATSGVYSGSFTGNANTGIIPVNLQKSATGLNLIGNPYPSAIDIDRFLLDPDNSTIVDGTIYLWTHNTAISSLIPGNNIYNYTADDYAKYNLTGGVRSASAAITGGAVPDGKVASGQAFFIEVNSSLPTGSYTALFKNHMRIENNNERFFRDEADDSDYHQDVNLNNIPVEKNRVWLSLSNPQDAFNEILIGYVAGASSGFDNLYDGKTLPTANVVSFYTVSGNDNYSIEGRGLPFNENDIFQLGYKTTISGNFKIEIDQTDGVFDSRDVFLIDHLTNQVQNLKEASYLFASDTGTFNSRFELCFVYDFNGTRLATKDIGSATNQISIYAYSGLITAQSYKTITGICVYDALGRELLRQNSHSNELTVPNPCAVNSIAFVRARLIDGTEVCEKIISK